MGEIERAQAAITLLRQEKALYQDSLASLEEDIAKADEEIRLLMQSIQSSQSNSKQSQGLMLSLKLKN